jgi:hypothetical protein
MKNILKISTHSFVDLITNSSSELFVCNGDKSVKTVKEIINQIFENELEPEYQEEWYKEELESHKGATPAMIWGEMFSDEIIVANRDFDINTYPDKEDLIIIGAEEYDRQHWDRENEHYMKTSQKIKAEIGEEPFKEEAYDVKSQKEEWKEWQEKAHEIRMKENNLKWKKHKEARKRIRDYFKLPEELEFCLDWDITCKKGDIFLQSKGDNTVPYAYFDAICHKLNAKRYHLG